MFNIDLKDSVDIVKNAGALKLWQCPDCGATCISLKDTVAYQCPMCQDPESRAAMVLVAMVLSIEELKHLTEKLVEEEIENEKLKHLTDKLVEKVKREEKEKHSTA